MNEVIISQLKIMLIFAISGFVIGLLFDVFRIRRKVYKFPNFVTYVEDILFWIISALVLLFTVMEYTTGELRIYMFFGLLVGSSIYFFFFSKYIVRFFTGIIKFILSFFHRLLSTVIKIVGLLKIKIVGLLKIKIGKLSKKTGKS